MGFTFTANSCISIVMPDDIESRILELLLLAGHYFISIVCISVSTHHLTIRPLYDADAMLRRQRGLYTGLYRYFKGVPAPGAMRTLRHSTSPLTTRCHFHMHHSRCTKIRSCNAFIASTCHQQSRFLYCCAIGSRLSSTSTDRRDTIVMRRIQHRPNYRPYERACIHKAVLLTLPHV